MPSRRSFAARTALGILTAAVMAACTSSLDPTPVAQITLQPGLDSIEVGATWNNWILTMRDANNVAVTGRTVRWESNNPGVATIDASSGLVTGVASGQTLITATVEGKVASATIKVLNPIVSMVALPDSFDLPLTTTRTITVQLVGPGGVALTNRVVTWASSSPGVAVVSTTGLVTPVSLGMTNISAHAGGKEVRVKVRVVGEPVNSVRITPQQTVHVIRLGQTRQLTAECLNVAQQVLAGRSITWNSSNPIVASVSQTGLVTGNALGTANISATCDNSVSASVTAQVTPVPVSTVTITPSGGLVLTDGTLGQLLATARDSAGNTLSLQGRSVQWFSDNQPVAAVSTTGVVAANSPGSANIHVVVDGVASSPVTVFVNAFYAMLGLPPASRAPLPTAPASADPRG